MVLRRKKKGEEQTPNKPKGPALTGQAALHELQRQMTGGGTGKTEAAKPPAPADPKAAGAIAAMEAIGGKPAGPPQKTAAQSTTPPKPPKRGFFRGLASHIPGLGEKKPKPVVRIIDEQSRAPPARPIMPVEAAPAVTRPAAPAAVELSPDEARYLRAMNLSLVNELVMAVEALMGDEEPNVSASVAAPYLKERSTYETAKGASVASGKASEFFQARARLQTAILTGQGLTDEEQTRLGLDKLDTLARQALHDRYFKSGDRNAAMNSILAKNAALKNL